MITCKSCEHAIYCPSWGEYRCVKKMKRIMDPVDLDCETFEKRKPGRVKPCNCNTCMERAKEV